MNAKIYTLIKIFDTEAHADAFIENGEMYCRTLGHFKKLEDGELRGDVYEGIISWLQPDQISVSISYKPENEEEKFIEIKELAAPVVIEHASYDRLNVYCMYAMKIPAFNETYETEEEKKQLVDKLNTKIRDGNKLGPEVVAFGEFAVMIYNVQDFINKVKETLQKKNFRQWHGPITYYDPETFSGSFDGIKAAFRKRNIYASQNEFRFAFDTNAPEGAQTIHVGNLSGIAIKIPTKDINDQVKIELTGKTTD